MDYSLNGTLMATNILSNIGRRIKKMESLQNGMRMVLKNKKVIQVTSITSKENGPFGMRKAGNIQRKIIMIMKNMVRQLVGMRVV